MLEEQNFLPDWSSPPGATIAKFLQARGRSLTWLAVELGTSVPHLQRLLNGSAEIDSFVAQSLERCLGPSSQYWLKRQTQYARSKKLLEQDWEGDKWKAWLSQLPYRDMVRLGWIEPCETSMKQKALCCLRFFGVDDLSKWNDRYETLLRNTAFRTTSRFQSTGGAVAAWLRHGETLARSIACARWNKRLLVESLGKIRSLTRIKDPCIFVPKLRKLCSESGVAVIIAPTPSSCRASGATYFLSEDKPILMLSFRYLADDQFWFTVFHELAHLILHDSRQLYLETDEPCRIHEELEANNYAANVLVPGHLQQEMRLLRPRSTDVLRFSVRIGIAPGIVVGQLQHFGLIKMTQLNYLKRRYEWEQLASLENE